MPKATPMERNPVLIILGGAAGVVTAGLVATNALTWTHLDPGQLLAVTTFVIVCANLLGSAIRAIVYSPATHAAEVNAALHTPVPDPPAEPDAIVDPAVTVSHDQDITIPFNLPG